MEDTERKEILQQLSAMRLVIDEAEGKAESALKLAAQVKEKVTAVERRLAESEGK